jgi:hypothetical protein
MSCNNCAKQAQGAMTGAGVPSGQAQATWAMVHEHLSRCQQCGRFLSPRTPVCTNPKCKLVGEQQGDPRPWPPEGVRFTTDTSKVGEPVVDDSPSPVDAQIQKLQSSDGATREEAAKALGELGAPEAVPALIQALTEDENWRVAWRAAEALGQIGDPEAVDTLIQAARRDNNDSVCLASIWALGEIGDPKAVDIAALGLKEDHPSFRAASANALGKIADERAVVPLALAAWDEDGLVRGYAMNALENIGGERAMPVLLRALTDNDPTVRKAAASMLGVLGDERAIPDLQKAYRQYKGRMRKSDAAEWALLAETELRRRNGYSASDDQPSSQRADSRTARGK